MPDLQHSLRDFDYRHLQIVADLWGIDLTAPDTRNALPLLELEIKKTALVGEMVEALPARAAEALSWLAREGGRVTWALFKRRYGKVREMGPGRRDRERPDQNPASPAEALWYRAFLARGFFEVETGPQEFAYIPNDLLEIVSQFIPNPRSEEKEALPSSFPLGRQATPEERRHITLATDQIIDHTCTHLAGLRMGINPSLHIPQIKEEALRFFGAILSTMGIIDPAGKPDPEQTRAFLSPSRGETLLRLWLAWRSSSTHNDLRLIPGVQAEGAWENDPLLVRKKVLDLLTHIPRETWWSISSLIANIKDKHPDLQRPSGDYDSWFLKDQDTGEYLRGFEHWDQVEGVLLRYLITGPLHWLGILDLAAPDDSPQSPATAFRFSVLSTSLLTEEPPSTLKLETDSIHVRAKGEIDIAVFVPRTARYQIARFCAWKPLKQNRYYYSLTPASLEEAEKHDLQITHLLTLLQSHAEVIPPNVRKALQRWRQQGVEASMEKETVLRTRSPEMLEALQKSRAARFLREQLGPTAVIIEEGTEAKIVDVLMEMGFLVGDDD